MGMRAYEDLNEMLCKEVEEIANKGELSAGDLETVHKLTDTIKNILKIGMLEEGGSSSDGRWNAEGSYGNGGYSGRHYVRGHYSRDGGNSYRGGYSRGRYSMAEGKEMLTEKIREMMNMGDIEPEDRKILMQALDKLER